MWRFSVFDWTSHYVNGAQFLEIKKFTTADYINTLDSAMKLWSLPINGTEARTLETGTDWNLSLYKVAYCEKLGG